MLDHEMAVQALMERILSSPALQDTCNTPFDVGRMWRGHDGEQLRSQLQTHFQNITSIMDCVGCEKCKLWGKLQFLGVATSLKILFASNNCFERSLRPHEMLAALKLERNEVIALVNLLAKLSHSVAAYREMSEELHQRDGLQPCFFADDVIS
jgi:ERO1-like protein alpha